MYRGESETCFPDFTGACQRDEPPRAGKLQDFK